MASAAKEAAAKTAYVCYLLHLQAAQHARTYVGITTNLARRIRQHNGQIAGGAHATKIARGSTGVWHLHGLVKGFPERGVATSFEAAVKTRPPVAIGLHSRQERMQGLSREFNKRFNLQLSWMTGAEFQAAEDAAAASAPAKKKRQVVEEGPPEMESATPAGIEAPTAAPAVSPAVSQPPEPQPAVPSAKGAPRRPIKASSALPSPSPRESVRAVAAGLAKSAAKPTPPKTPVRRVKAPKPADEDIKPSSKASKATALKPKKRENARKAALPDAPSPADEKKKTKGGSRVAKPKSVPAVRVPASADKAKGERTKKRKKSAATAPELSSRRKTKAAPEPLSNKAAKALKAASGKVIAVVKAAVSKRPAAPKTKKQKKAAPAPKRKSIGTERD